MKKLLTSILLSFTISFAGFGQDTHYAQFDKAPLLLNPGLTGMGKGFNRFSLGYRTQWGPLEKAYSTMYFSFDMPILSSGMSNQKSYIGVGVDFFSDNAGSGRLATNHFGFSLSGILKAGEGHTISLGFNGAFEQRTLASPNNLSWDSQWDGTQYDPTLTSGEVFFAQTYSYMDFSTGAAWKYEQKNNTLSAFSKLAATAGIGYFHFTNPRFSFYGVGEDQLYQKFVFHGRATLGVSDNYITLNPGFYFAHQGPYNTFIGGAVLKYFFRSDTKYTGFENEKAIGLGLHVRGGDALIPSFVFEVKGFEMGLSYDYTISTLQQANNGVGGFEISLRYNDTYGTIFNQGDKHVLYF